eukprot:gene8608-6341_t
MPPGIKVDEIVEVFSGIGKLTRERPKGRGVFKDQILQCASRRPRGERGLAKFGMQPLTSTGHPLGSRLCVKIYEGGKDAVIQYEESQAAHAAPAFFDGEEWKGVHIKVRTRFIC